MIHYEKTEVIRNVVTLDEIISCGAIYFETIQEGFERFDYFMMEGTAEEIHKEIKRLQELNGIENSYVDFYYGKLTKEEKLNLIEGLGLNDFFLQILEKYEKLDDVVFLKLDDDILDLTVQLNAKEILFSTYYFCKYPCTVWGNYDLKYPVFTESKV